MSSELDHHTAPLALDEVRRQISTGQPPRVMIDMVFVNFIDARGVGEIVRLRNELTLAGGELRLDRWTRRVGRVLTLTRLLPALGSGAGVEPEV